MDLEDLSKEEIGAIFQRAEELREFSVLRKKKLSLLAGKTVVNLFFESSTRTRTSFSLAARRLGADTVDFSPSGSSLSKGETFVDTAKNIEAMGIDAIVVRHSSPGAPRLLAQTLHCPVINAGDGVHEHPTQGLLDIYTILRARGRVDGLTVGLVGDIAHSRVARSNIHGLLKLGAHVIVCGPPTLIPQSIGAAGRPKSSFKLDAILPRCDVINMLRIQFERQRSGLFPSIREYARLFGMDQQRLQLAKPDLLLLAPGPINRGVEITPDVADGPHSAILQQVSAIWPTNRLCAWPSSVCSSHPGARVLEDRRARELLLHLRSVMSILRIANGRVIDPAQHLDQTIDLWIQNDRVLGMGPAFEHEADHELDATGKIVCPGLIDMHVHLREPGREEDETIATGTAAALAGGVTSVACMPNTEPALDNQAAAEFITLQAGRAGNANVFPVGAITKGRKGEELAEMGGLVEGGAVAFSDDGSPVVSSEIMRRALEYCGMFDKAVLSHSEDLELSRGGIMNEGYESMRLGLPGYPAAAEEVGVHRDIAMAELTGGRLHILHVSTAGSVDLIRRAKRRGVHVSGEACPHHFTLTDRCMRTFDSNFKMSPPLRTEEDVKAILAGLADGTLEVIATDHAPHAPEKKMRELDQAPNGIIGLETLLPVCIKALIEPKILTWPQLIEKLTVNPARVLSIARGTLRPGSIADVTVIDPAVAWTIDPAEFKSKSRNCPFAGWPVHGRATAVVVAGKIKMIDGKRV